MLNPVEYCSSEKVVIEFFLQKCINSYQQRLNIFSLE
jgi:hypothetical protein